MTVQGSNEEERLLSVARVLGVAITSAKVRALLSYIEQIHKWNRTYNLTALRDVNRMLVQHVFDSLAIVSSLQAKLSAQGLREQATIMDVGSGAGLPGVVLAVINSEWQVHCVDAVEKKVAFIRQMSGVLALPNLQAVHGRVETLASMNADIVVSRAFAALSDFAILAGKHVAPGGWLLAMKGREPQDEIRTLEQETEWRVARIEPLVVPELDAQRCLVWMSRQGNP